MAEKLYEGMFLLDSGKFAEDPEGVTQSVMGLLEKIDGTVVVHRPWQDGRLAYPVDGHRKGLHYLACFRMDSLRLPELDRACKLNEFVLRHLVIKHPKVLFDALVDSLGPEQPQAEEPGEATEPVAEAAAPATDAAAPAGETTTETTT